MVGITLVTSLTWGISMQLRSDRYRPSTDQRVYQPTGKEIPFQTFGRKEDAYYMLAGMIENELGPEGGTIMDIYNNVTGPKGLSTSDTIKLVKSARREGYLK